MALNQLVSLIGRLVARSGRKRGIRQTDGRTDGRNDKTTTVRSPKVQKFIDTAQCEHEYTNTQLISVKLAKVTQNTEMELL